MKTLYEGLLNQDQDKLDRTVAIEGLSSHFNGAYKFHDADQTLCMDSDVLNIHVDWDKGKDARKVLNGILRYFDSLTLWVKPVRFLTPRRGKFFKTIRLERGGQVDLRQGGIRIFSVANLVNLNCKALDGQKNIKPIDIFMRSLSIEGEYLQTLEGVLTGDCPNINHHSVMQNGIKDAERYLKMKWEDIKFSDLFPGLKIGGFSVCLPSFDPHHRYWLNFRKDQHIRKDYPYLKTKDGIYVYLTKLHWHEEHFPPPVDGSFEYILQEGK